MVQSSGCTQESLGTTGDTAADCGLRLTHRSEDLAWPGTQKKYEDLHCGDVNIPDLLCVVRFV